MHRLAGIVFEETVRELVYAPLWWYTRGAVRALGRFRLRLREGDEHIGLSVWLRNIFVPMYGQTDLTGRLISFVIRLAQVFVRSIVFAVWSIISIILLLGYFFLPVLVFVQLYSAWK